MGDEAPYAKMGDNPAGAPPAYNAAAAGSYGTAPETVNASLVATAVPAGNANGGFGPATTSTKETGSRNPERTEWRDLPWAILFWLHAFVIFILACTLGADATQADNSVDQKTYDDGTLNDDGEEVSGSSAITGGIFLMVFVAGVLSAGYTKFMCAFAESIIHCMLIGNIVLVALMAFIFFSVGFVAGGVIFLIFAMLTACYYYVVRNRIPFAATNLKVATTAVNEMPATLYYAYGIMLVQILWCVLWCLALYGTISDPDADSVTINGDDFDLDDCYQVTSTTDEVNKPTGCYCGNESDSDPHKDGDCIETSINGGIWFLMLVSFYWGVTTISNVVHCTVAGAVATWWFNPAPGKSPVTGALKRSLTTSFGSIAFGSLLVAIIKATRQVVRAARDNKDIGPALACVLDCMLGILESLLEIFNRYAFCYVGIYGYDFRTAGRSVWTLFKERGLTVIVNDDLLDNVFLLGCILVGVISCGIAYGYGKGAGMDGPNTGAMAFIGFFIGFVLCLLTMTTVSSAVATVFVCFAEDPAPFAQYHPDLHTQLVTTWQQFYPGDYHRGTGAQAGRV